MRVSPPMLVGLGSILLAFLLGAWHEARTGDASVRTFVASAAATGLIVYALLRLRLALMVGWRPMPRPKA